MMLYYPDPINRDWVRVCLLEAKTQCEWWTCTQQATTPIEGRKTVIYVCDQHTKTCEMSPGMARKLEAHLYQVFQEGFNFIHQVHASGGQLLQAIDDREQEIKDNARTAVKETRTASAQARRIIREHLSKGKVGLPDDDLAASRGVQSPSRDPFQVVFRVPEPAPPSPVILPPNPEVVTSLLEVRLF